MSDHFRVRRRLEHIAFAFQAGFQLLKVLDDTVVADRDDAFAAEVRMSIPFGRRSMRRPTRVSDAGRAVQRRTGESRREPVDAPRRLADRNVTRLVRDRDTRTVVAAILQPSQAFQQELTGFAMPDVANDSTHFRAAPTCLERASISS